MANGPKPAAGSGDTDGPLGNLNKLLENRVIAFLVVVILGGGGAAGYMNINPPRPDPWTGTMDRNRMSEYDRHLWRELSTRLAPFDQHLIQATDGWAKIYTMQEKIGNCEDDIAQLHADVKQLLRERMQR